MANNFSTYEVLSLDMLSFKYLALNLVIIKFKTNSEIITKTIILEIPSKPFISPAIAKSVTNLMAYRLNPSKAANIKKENVNMVKNFLLPYFNLTMSVHFLF